MITPFQYRKISRRFIEDDLMGRLGRGESCVLLGHPGGGKGYVCSEIVRRLVTLSSVPIVQVNFAVGSTITQAGGFVARIKEAVRLAGGQADYEGDRLLGDLEALGPGTPRLIASNVDAVSHHLARRFLQEVREQVEHGQFVVVLTGEFNFHELVHGENSEFTATGQYVLEGFAPDEFELFVDRQTQVLGIAWSAGLVPHVWLHALTGGNPDVVKALFETCQECRFHRHLDSTSPWDRDWISAQLADWNFASVLHQRIVRHAIRLVPTDPASWPLLQQLLAGKQPVVRTPAGPPSVLSLSGLAGQTNGRLAFGSELMRAAATDYFTPRTLGDLYASASKWLEAFQYYGATQIEDRRRPVTALDREPTERLINALGPSLRAASAHGTLAVRRLFTSACELAFAIPEVVFWRYLSSWEPQATESDQWSSEAGRIGLDILAGQQTRLRDRRASYSLCDDEARIEVGERWRDRIHGLMLKGDWDDQPMAVLIGDFSHQERLSHERRRIVEQLLGQFREAHDRAAELERNKRLLKYRQRFEEITAGIVEALGDQILNVEGVMRSAAAGIRQLGYRRVFFSLIEPDEQHIRGAWMDAVDDRFKARDSYWPLSHSSRHIQPFVVMAGQPELIEDARNHPLTDKGIVERGNIIGFALVPLRGESGPVRGTLHLERDDHTPLSRDEVHEFVEFGKILTALLEQGERIHLLQSALNHQLEPLLIIDMCRRVRYANQPAAQLVPVLEPGRWQPAVGKPDTHTLRPLGRQLAMALEGRPVFHQFQGLGDNPNFYGSMLARAIQDEKGEKVGAFVYIRDLNWFARLLAALEMAAQADDVNACVDRLLDATKVLGHQWGHLWVVDTATGDLVARHHFNSPDPGRFHGMRLPSREKDPNNNRWLCFAKRAPVVFSFSETEPEGWFITENGVDVFRESKTRQFPRKTGDYWVEVPLISGREDIGKMVLQCESSPTQEQLEALHVLAQTVLDGFIRRAQLIRKEQAELSLAKLSHMVGTRYAWLSPTLSLYRLLERECPALIPINEDFRKNLLELDEILRHAKKMLQRVSPQPTEFDIVRMLQECIAPLAVPHVYYEGVKDLTVRADAWLLKGAITEILGNAMKAMKRSPASALTLRVEELDTNGGPFVRITICDTGPGVPHEHKPSIFDEFFSYDPNGDLGTGLGLYHVQQVVRAHGGRVREDGLPGEGGRFVIDLPLLTPSVPATSQEAVASE